MLELEPKIRPRFPVVSSLLQHSLASECVHIHRALIMTSNQGEVITVDKDKTNIFPTVNSAGCQITFEATLHKPEAKMTAIRYISKGIGQHEHNCTGNRGKNSADSWEEQRQSKQCVLFFFPWIIKCLFSKTHKHTHINPHTLARIHTYNTT